MSNKRLFQLYMIIWTFFVCVLLIGLVLMHGDEQTTNYTGLVRGATQKVIAGELYGEVDDEAIYFVDDVIGSLQNGTNIYNSLDLYDAEFQSRLSEIEGIWVEIKDEIQIYRVDQSNGERIYDLGQAHFLKADELVDYVAEKSLQELNAYVLLFMISLSAGVVFVYVAYTRGKQALVKSVSEDILTGALSRHGFEQAAKELLRVPTKQKYMILRFDIAQFKLLNNRYGYEVGNRLLCSMVEAMNAWKKKPELIGRLLADDFMILAKNDENYVEELQEILYGCIQSSGFIVRMEDVQFKFGAYQIDDPSEVVNSIMDHATMAHKYAKSREDQSVVWYNGALLSDLQKAQFYVEHMPLALEKREFQMYIQPQVNLRTNTITSGECLVRWQLPDGKFVLPDQFIPMFEKKGLMSQLDFYMLERACEFLHQLPEEDMKQLTLAVNFSRTTLYQVDFRERFLAMVERYGIPHRCIEVEVVETALNQLEAVAMERLQTLQDMNFKVAVDDFGAGYSSLSFLSEVPTHTLKLDRQFLWGMDRSEKMKDIIETTVDMAHKIKVQITCEGVETEGHMDFVRNIGCDFAQGYFIARPMPNTDFKKCYMNLEWRSHPMENSISDILAK